MRKILCLFLVSIIPGIVTGNENNRSETAVSALTPELEPYDSSSSVSTSFNRALESNRIVIGTILKSYHFEKDKYDYHDYNDSHDGIYLMVNSWSAGTYINSADNRSVFVAYNSNLYRNNSIAVDIISGIANGYEGWENAQGDYLPILGFSAQWTYLKTFLTYDAMTFGLELPLN